MGSPIKLQNAFASHAVKFSNNARHFPNRFLKMIGILLWMAVSNVFGSPKIEERVVASLTESTLTRASSICSRGQIDVSTVLFASHLSCFVYEKPADRHDHIIRNHGLTQLSFWNIEASFGEVAGRVWLFNDRTLFVVFRGTASLTDAFINSHLYRAEVFTRMGRVHGGFFLRMRRMKKQIDNIIVSNILSFDRIVFAGHSLGGAVAVLAALQYAHSRTASQIEVVTFGSPKVGNLTFGKYFNFYIKSHTRVVVNDDPVVKLPPRILGYEHAPGGCVVNLSHESSGSGIFDKLEAHRLVIYQTQLEHLST